MAEYDYDVLVIGSGPSGQRAAIQSAKLHKRVAVIERKAVVGGVCVNTGTIHSKTMREAVLHLSGYRYRNLYGQSYTVKQVSAIEPMMTEHGERVKIQLASGKQIQTDQALYSIGRRGVTDELNLAVAGLEADSRGRLKVNERFQTEVPHIYAVGDLISFPSLASTSMEQGRLAACHAAGVPATLASTLFPYEIYTIPEISMVGRTEEDLTDEGVPYEIGTAHYREIARGQIIGDHSGLRQARRECESRLAVVSRCRWPPRRSTTSPMR